MTPLITLRDPMLIDRPDPEEIDPEAAIAAARRAGYPDEVAASIGAVAAHLPMAAGPDGRPLGWSIREVRHLRFLRAVVDGGGFADDLVGLTPEPLPPIVREDGNEPRDGIWP